MSTFLSFDALSSGQASPLNGAAGDRGAHSGILGHCNERHVYLEQPIQHIANQNDQKENG
jgi:hypothetical protein